MPFGGSRVKTMAIAKNIGYTFYIAIQYSKGIVQRLGVIISRLHKCKSTKNKNKKRKYNYLIGSDAKNN